MSKNKCQFKLRGKYNGVWGYNNADLTDEKAEKLAKEHPRGYDLFSELPKDLAGAREKEKAKKEAEYKAKVDKIKEDQRLLKEKKIKEEKDDIAHREAIRKQIISDRLKAEKDFIKAKKRKTVIDIQNEAERKKAELEQEERERIRKRLQELIGKDRNWLSGKAKKLGLSSKGTSEEIAKRIHDNE